MQRILGHILPPVHTYPLTSIEALQQKTLNALTWGTGIACLILRLILLILGNPGRTPLHSAISFFLVGIIAILLMERFVPYWLASLTFNVLIIVWEVHSFIAK